jgi:pimeloyl-ACP methyl ester carboxylesterase
VEKMNKVISKDGTTIAVYQNGTGQPLILVHGTGSNAARWQPIIPDLSKHFRVITVDRRGYGKSDDNPEYAIEREFEDIAAVVDSFREPVNLLGHSFGALCAIEAALRTQNIAKLILYEPAFNLPGIVLYPDGILDEMQTLLDAGDREGVLTKLYREVGMFPQHEMDQLITSPDWPTRIASAHIVLRESRAEDNYRFEARRFREIITPTLMLSGSDSPQFLKTVSQTVDEALPNSKIVVLQGQQHLAVNMAPKLFVQETMPFLSG